MSPSTIPCAPTRAGDPETSFEAAEKVDTSRMQIETLHALEWMNGEPVEAWRVQEGVEQLMRVSVADSTIRTRLSELARKGLVVVVDREGRSRTGHRCSRYRLAEVGVAA